MRVRVPRTHTSHELPSLDSPGVRLFSHPMDVYARVVPEMQQQAASAMDGLLFGQ